MRSEVDNPIPLRKDEVDLAWLVQQLRRQWKKLFLIWAAIVSVSLLVLVNLKPAFVSTGALYVSESKSSGKGSGQSGSLSDFLPELGTGSDVETQKELIKGKDLSLRVITRLGLNTRISGDPRYLAKTPVYWQWRIAGRDPSLYSPGIELTDSLMKPGVYRTVHYRIHFKDPRSFQLLQGDGASIDGQLDRTIETKDVSFMIRYNGKEEIRPGSDFELSVDPPQVSVDRFLGALSVTGGGKGLQKTNLIYTSYTSGSPYLSQMVVKTLFTEFIAQNQSWATSVSRATLEFVDRQLAEMRIELERSSSKLTAFQKSSGLVSLEPQVQADLKRLIDYEIQLRNEQLKLFEMERLAEGLRSGAPEKFLLSFSQNPLFQSLGVKLGELGPQIATLQSQYQEGYPPLKLLKSQQKAILAELKSVVDNDLKQIRSGVQQLTQTVQDYKTKFKNLPEESKSLTEYLRSTKVYEDVFLFLFQEKQRAKISEASTLSGIHVVDQAPLPLRENTPHVRSMLAWAGMVGFFLAGGFIIIPALRIRCFTSAEEVKEGFSQPVFALVPDRGKSVFRSTPAVLEGKSQNPYAESIRLLRTNLLYAMAGKKQQTVLITSAFPGDGKTSIISNLAAMLIRSERVDRVLIIDADMHHPSLHGVFDLIPSPGLSNYLNGEAPLERLIQSIPFGEHKRIDVLCAGPVPPTPVELVETEAMQALLDYGRRNYTFTLIDTPAYPLVTSAVILADKVDRILTVVRIGHTDRQLFRRHVGDLLAVNDNLGLVVNMAAGKEGAYGYDYGHSYGEGNGNGGVNGNRHGDESEVKKRTLLQRLKERR